jgi:CBS domain-containing protein
MSIVQQGLLAQGGRMKEIWALMSSFRDALTRRLMVLAIENMRKQGKEPLVLEFCWITFGTPGRRETLLHENFLEGFIYKDPEKGQEDESEAYATALANEVKKGLVACGLLDRQHGQILCLPESKWKELFIHLADGNTYPDLDTFRVFDLWGTCEEQGLVRNFREYIIPTVQHQSGLLDRMRAANDAFTVPDCFYRDKIVMSGGLQQQLNLKQHVLTPLVSAVRLLSLERGIGALSTKDRVEALSEMGVVSRERANDLQAIYPWLVEICLKRALDQGVSLNWILDPQQCSSDEKRLLTESFRMVKETVEKAS